MFKYYWKFSKTNDMPGNLAICWDSLECKRLPIDNLTYMGQSAGDYYKNKILRDCALNIFIIKYEDKVQPIIK